MCGRYTLDASPDDLLLHFEVERTPLEKPRFNMAPGQEHPVVGLRADGRRSMSALRWGLVPRWAKTPRQKQGFINARSETASQKPTFRDAYRKRRCVVPATGFYEWRSVEGGAKRPHWIHLTAGGIFAFAGLFEASTYAILTKEAEGELATIHARMPVVLAPADYDGWLAPTTDADALDALRVGLPGEAFAFHEVSTAVNRVSNDDPGLVRPFRPA